MSTTHNSSMASPGDGATPPPRAKRRPRWPKRWWTRLLFLAIVLPVVANLALNIFLFLAPSLLFSSEARTKVDWRIAWTWWPARIYFWGVELTGTGNAGSWRAELDSATVDHDLDALFDRTFHTRLLTAEGARFTWSPRAATAAPLPPRRPSTSTRRPWRLVFDDIQIGGLTSVRVGQRFIDGSKAPGQVQGTVVIETRGGPVTIPRVHVDWVGAEVRIRDGVTGALHGLRLDGSIDTFRPRQDRGLALLGFINADLEIQADRWDFDLVEYFLRDVPAEVSGDGVLDARLRLERGHLKPGTTVRLEGDDLSVRYLDLVGTGKGHLELGVASADTESEPRLHLNLVVDPFAGPHLRSGADGLHLEATSPTLNLADPKPQVRASMRLTDAEVPDFSVYQDLLPAKLPLRLLGGTGRVDLRFDFDTAAGEGTGDVALRADNINASYQDHAVAGDLALTVQLVDGDPTGRRFRLGASRFDLDNVVFEGVEDRPWWARIEIPDGQVVLGEPLDVEAHLVAQVADSRPLVLLVPNIRKVPFWKRLLGVRPIAVSGGVRFDATRWALRDLSLRAGRAFSGRAEIELADETAAGVALFELGPLGVGVEIDAAGDHGFKTRRPRSWYREQAPIWRQKLGDQAGN